MAYTQTDLDKLDKAIATGAKSVRFGTGENAHETVFRDLDQMLAIRSLITSEIASSSGTTTRVTFVEHTRD